MMNVDEAISKAYELQGWIQSAAGDMAFDIAKGYYDDDYEKWLENDGKDVNPAYRADAYADVLYSNVDWLCDMTGDRIYDEGNGDYEDMILIAMALQDFANSDLKKACEKHINRWLTYIKKEGK